jgi:iron complex outermembrane recepter protein
MRLIISCLFSITFFSIHAQSVVSGKIYDSQTKEALIGANIVATGTSAGTATNIDGRFAISVPAGAREIQVSYIGYETKIIAITSSSFLEIELSPSASNLQQIVVTANREASLRTESPIAISKLSTGIIQETKPVLITELVNKVPGVVMLNYNNEQHGMAIRQPMGTSAYFLYMEDGIPLRPMGIFNHNALIEMNVFNLSSIEVVKGPASSLYGPEAVGGAINFISHRPTAVPTIRAGVQMDQWGYKRIQYGAGATINNKLGFFLSGFEARQRDSWQKFSNYDKSSINARIDYNVTEKTKLLLSFSGNEYYSDMAGSVDSVAFYNREYTSTTDFTYRKVHSHRVRFALSHQWNEKQETTVNLVYRNNFIEQNPNYSIRWTTGSQTATGEVNRNTFHSKVALIQHSIKLNFLETRILAGGSIDVSPTRYWAYKTNLTAELRGDGKSVEKYTLANEEPESFLSNYHADLTNSAVYSQLELNPFQRLRVTIGVRYDNMSFTYNNHLNNTAGSKTFRQVTPKLGATYDLGMDRGIYVNYSHGFAPPGLTAIFRRKPSTDPNAPPEFYDDLKPATFHNMEVGGWAALFQNKVYVDATVYRMIGQRELLSVRQPDNSTDYQSAGRTLHRGIEYGLTYKPAIEWSVRFGGTNALHRFEQFDVSARNSDVIKNVNGNDMPQSPRWIANSELTYAPRYLKGLRASIEWQRIGAWYQDQLNRVKYDDAGFLGMKGVSYLNFRTGYTYKGFEVFVNVMNLTNELYANSASRGNSSGDRSTYTPAAPRTFVTGMQYNFSAKRTKS